MSCLLQTPHRFENGLIQYTFLSIFYLITSIIEMTENNGYVFDAMKFIVHNNDSRLKLTRKF